MWTTPRSGETRLPNRLAMLESQAIQSFAAAVHSERAISKAPGVSRGAPRRHLASDEANRTKAPTGSERVAETEKWRSPSVCAGLRDRKNRATLIVLKAPCPGCNSPCHIHLRHLPTIVLRIGCCGRRSRRPCCSAFAMTTPKRRRECFPWVSRDVATDSVTRRRLTDRNGQEKTEQSPHQTNAMQVEKTAQGLDQQAGEQCTARRHDPQGELRCFRQARGKGPGPERPSADRAEGCTNPAGMARRGGSWRHGIRFVRHCR